eukprot:GDKJ01001403.1.p1 GENE.GDKJ01001403.1~~GDKJ01001403.1.p1  ORF type:complete len:218 (+),score=25.54 GDKJ01001403.1:24-656(+)
MGNAGSSLTPHDLQKYWNKHDVDGSGSISPDELEMLLKDIIHETAPNEPLGPQFMAAMFNALDDDGDGIITWDEFQQKFFELWENRAAIGKPLDAKAETRTPTASRPVEALQTHPSYSNSGMGCPNCQLKITDDQIRAYIAEANANALREGRPAPFDVRPGTGFYAPKIYPGMQTTGMIVGQIPPSFFSSPYNTHSWFKGLDHQTQLFHR